MKRKHYLISMDKIFSMLNWESYDLQCEVSSKYYDGKYLYLLENEQGIIDGYHYWSNTYDPALEEKEGYVICGDREGWIAFKKRGYRLEEDLTYLN